MIIMIANSIFRVGSHHSNELSSRPMRRMSSSSTSVENNSLSLLESVPNPAFDICIELRNSTAITVPELNSLPSAPDTTTLEARKFS